MKRPVMRELPLKVPHTESDAAEQLAGRLHLHLQPVPLDRRIVVVCIGTDRSTGDALGPLIGTQLAKNRSPHFELFGTLDEPVHAMNLEETMLEINRKVSKPFIIGIDACLGQLSSVGCIQLGPGPVRPGAGVNKDLPPVGDIHMTGIVNVGGFMEYFVLQNTRLNLVMRMADMMSDVLHHTIGSVRAYSIHAATQD
ncbi:MULTISPECIES: spore protease YyaC [Paenibacillus]|uniref:spore protease YyaC n=1 Tax=Paenibacillus TaxID=44249 RepID=UPI00095533B2|nr:MULTISPECIES: spore protease YyaC [Paenibacillus]ASS67637.1 spore protease YyaC [Paenibacillus sp. RUD330]SIQ69816.1 putative sporulation protein YyaC [Paenibacillus sp. RU4X]SIQ91671.1 putative sporulation protein YyaC [Paenibacillus sp. RU4T]